MEKFHDQSKGFEDPRTSNATLHDFAELLAISPLSSLYGGLACVDMADFADDNKAVANLFAGREKRKTVPIGKFEAMIADAVDDDISAEAIAAGGRNPAHGAQRELRNLGFTWSRIGSAHECEPGIPSLMDCTHWRAKIDTADE